MQKKGIFIFTSPQIASAEGGQLCNLLKSEEAIFFVESSFQEYIHLRGNVLVKRETSPKEGPLFEVDGRRGSRRRDRGEDRKEVCGGEVTWIICGPVSLSKNKCS